MNSKNSMKWHAYPKIQLAHAIITEWFATNSKVRKSITWFPNKANWLTFLKFAMRNDSWGRRDNIEAAAYELLLGQEVKREWKILSERKPITHLTQPQTWHNKC